ncbi:Threonine/homoserine efflux transporter RhtA [Catalinimonas alkaloidigena]|uniref:Threonine/homoserine efflux transporter RhtA n=2 Tax=Catalinimonas alkaloidigena TaxID=1075417 RepID=A0A1G9RBD8_9BACT|nr:Threonine/homoserine efflux transporter RhtA [Catalinimonas alkaloidigena]
MLAFAANSVLCRQALKLTSLDAATFTSVRLLSGALALLAILTIRGRVQRQRQGNWGSALMLFVYAAAFSFAYLSLATGTGALLLFGAVQMTMVFAGLRAGERLQAGQWAGLAGALGGLVYLVLPGLEAPSPQGAAGMLMAGVAWGLYSLRGRATTDPVGATAGNFLRATPMALLLSLFTLFWFRPDPHGMLYAVLSGAVTSGVGYVIWYAALPHLRATQAATVQLSVPVLAALGGILLLGEPLTTRLVLASVAILGGIAAVLWFRSGRPIR